MLRSTFSGFSMAQRALLANQRAIDVAGQNLSNINTRGYTRQRLDLSSIQPGGASYGSSRNDIRVGYGVQMTGINQIRDQFLDVQFRNQIPKVGTADSMDQILDELGQIFDETEKSAIGDSLNDAISQLLGAGNVPNSGEGSTESVVRSAFEVLMNAIHEKGNAVNDLEKEIIEKLETDIIPTINTCLQNIKDLNESIKTSQILGSPALELKDQRNMLLDDLATYLPIQVRYREDESTGTKLDLLEVTFRTQGNPGEVYTLISDSNIGELTFDGSGGVPVSLTVTDATDPTKVDVEISDVLNDGVLKGNIDMLNKAGIFDQPASDVQGIGYYRGMMDSFVDKLATLMNDLNAEKDANGNITVRHDLFETSDGSDKFTATNIMVSEAWKNGTVTLNKGDGITDGKYDNIHNMVNALSSDSHEFTIQKPILDANGDPVLDGNGDPTFETVTIFNGTVQNCYNNIQSTQAIERAATASSLDNHITVLNQISNSRDSVSAVNQDEEVMDIMRYQQSYNAASRLMTALDELLDKLINSTGIVGR